jgi:mono/diheme cytochrome c family protein
MANHSTTPAIVRTRHRATRALIGTVVLCGAWVLTGRSTDAQRVQAPTLLTESVDGGDAFARFCASCHGRAGKGDGPVAEALRYKPTDLTQLARRNDGVFPTDRVRALLVGYDSPLKAHGESDMPVWGVIFRSLDSSDTRAAVRIENLVSYVEKLQEPPRASDGLGARLFLAHCASCHGRDARGNGIMTESLRHAPPDLTRFTTRNGGVFPRERIAQIIDGRGIAAHGDRDMPIWGNAFKRTSDDATPEAVAARVRAIADYLEAIQQRGAE